MMDQLNPLATAEAERLLAAGVSWQVIEAELDRIQTQADPVSGQPICFSDEQIAEQLRAAFLPAPDVTVTLAWMYRSFVRIDLYRCPYCWCSLSGRRGVCPRHGFIEV